MARYDPLKRFLSQQSGDQVAMTFAELERIIGAKLPSSALEGNAWWSNNPTNHAQALAWLNAGFETANVDRTAGKLVFRRRKTVPEPAEPPEPVDCHPAVGALQGLLWIDPEFDLCRPVFESAPS
jgi:hypothetical protein